MFVAVSLKKKSVSGVLKLTYCQTDMQRCQPDDQTVLISSKFLPITVPLPTWTEDKLIAYFNETFSKAY